MAYEDATPLNADLASRACHGNLNLASSAHFHALSDAKLRHTITRIRREESGKRARGAACCRVLSRVSKRGQDARPERPIGAGGVLHNESADGETVDRWRATTCRSAKRGYVAFDGRKRALIGDFHKGERQPHGRNARREPVASHLILPEAKTRGDGCGINVSLYLQALRRGDFGAHAIHAFAHDFGGDIATTLIEDIAVVPLDPPSGRLRVCHDKDCPDIWMPGKRDLL